MKKTIELAQVRQGEVFEFAGERFVRLSEEQTGAILVLREDVLPESCTFEDANATRDDHNNFMRSNLLLRLTDWLMKNSPLESAAITRQIDLTTMDGMTDYDTEFVRVRALTVMEYQRYRRYIPLAPKAWWTATGDTTLSSPFSNSNYAWYVRTDGTLNNIGRVCYYYFAARPALYLKSSISVSVEIEGGGKELKDYTDRELLDELARRDDARHTAPARG